MNGILNCKSSGLPQIFPKSMESDPIDFHASEDFVVGRITAIRGQRVMLDADLAELYGVETRRLNEQVRRNRAKFPADFIFQLTSDEFKNLKSQFATSSWGDTSWGGT